LDKYFADKNKFTVRKEADITHTYVVNFVTSQNM